MLIILMELDAALTRSVLSAPFTPSRVEGSLHDTGQGRILVE